MRQKGFTLVEMLVVIGLLALLFIALLPLITGSEESNKKAMCKTMVLQAAEVAKQYNSSRRSGDFPPDDFRDTRGKLKVQPANGYNSGIESFLFFVNRSDSGMPRFPERDDNLGNTDEDKGNDLIAKLDRKDRVELIDPWGNPLAYFHFRNYGREQNYKMGGGDDEEQAVQPHRQGTRTLNANTFQIFSAGPDGVFNTADDIGNFTTPEDN